MKTGMRWMTLLAIVSSAMLPRGASAADMAGKWVAEITGPMLLEPAYARVTLERTGDTLGGTWASYSLKGTVSGSSVTMTLTDTDGHDAVGRQDRRRRGCGLGNDGWTGTPRRSRDCSRSPRADATGDQLEVVA